MQPFEKIGMKSVVKEISKLISVYSLLATVLKKKRNFWCHIGWNTFLTTKRLIYLAKSRPGNKLGIQELSSLHTEVR